MKIEGWRYYNHAALPDTPPHVMVNEEPIKNGSIWDLSKSCYLARWITNFDCEEETNWWYILKDTPFEIEELKSKRRYEINKGKKNYRVEEIQPLDYKEEIYRVQVEAYSAYPEKYRPVVDKDILFEEMDRWDYYKFYGAFSKQDNTLCGYAWLNRKGKYIYYAFHKVVPSAEKMGINASIVAAILEGHRADLSNGCYICDGSRSISHESHFQDYLEKYFGFRKAYCKLHVIYRPIIKPIVYALYPFRSVIKKLDNNSFIHNINGILRMEELVRN